MKTEQTVNTEHAGEEIKAPRPRRTKNYRPGRNNRSYGNEMRTGKEEKSEKEEKAVKPQAAEGQRINRSRRPVGRGKRAAAAETQPMPKVKIIPLGGLEQIGMNITAFECEDSIIIVDCGLAFPSDDMLGIDLVIPDVTYLTENIDKVKGFVITHGHEDHIGALPYILKPVSYTHLLDDLALFVNLGARTIEASETEDKDWINNWKQYFKPFTVDHILIKPTWEEIPEEHKDKLLIQIDPGTAFGTGMHETTQLCIRQLQKYVTPETKVLDVGTGSGILGIAALKLGAKEVKGTDLDENAIQAVGENLESNQISSDKFAVVQGNIIDDKEVQDWAGYEWCDIAVANILADVIILLQKEIPVHIKHGGIFITSGIINMKEQAVREVFEANDEFEVIEVTYQGEWVSVTARRK